MTTVLVTSASRHGATAEIGAEIARVLTERGHVCIEAPAGDSSPEACDAVVLGSAVYVGRWLEPARRFAEEHRDALAQRPVWLFSSGPVGDPLRPDDAHAVDTGDIERTTQARTHRVFPGRVDRSALGPLERTVLRAVGAAEGDYRDWSAVRAFANEIADAL